MGRAATPPVAWMPILLLWACTQCMGRQQTAVVVNAVSSWQTLLRICPQHPTRAVPPLLGWQEPYIHMCIYDMLSREITIHAVMYGVYS
jgi:hypothetical protein